SHQAHITAQLQLPYNRLYNCVDVVPFGAPFTDWGKVPQCPATGTKFTFEYGSDLIEAGSAGLVWTESKIAEFIENPKEFLRETLNKPRARSSMTLKFSNKEDRRNVAAYIATFSDSAAATTPEN
ncbi:MAG: hypothetical protein QNL54_10415, partial [Rhodobacterales bacterium]